MRSNFKLQTSDREDSNINSSPCLHPEDIVRIGWHCIKMMALDQTNLKEFIKYFQDSWFVGQFPPMCMLWNVFGLDEHFIFNSNISKIVLLNN